MRHGDQNADGVGGPLAGRDARGRRRGGLPLALDSPSWFAWLEAPATRSFAYPVYDAAHGWIDSFLTVRKERRQRGGAYWTAYRHVGGRLRTVYLGRAATVTDARVRAIAATVLENP